MPNRLITTGSFFYSPHEYLFRFAGLLWDLANLKTNLQQKQNSLNLVRNEIKKTEDTLQLLDLEFARLDAKIAEFRLNIERIEQKCTHRKSDKLQIAELKQAVIDFTEDKQIKERKALQLRKDVIELNKRESDLVKTISDKQNEIKILERTLRENSIGFDVDQKEDKICLVGKSFGA